MCLCGAVIFLVGRPGGGKGHLVSLGVWLCFSPASSFGCAPRRHLGVFVAVRVRGCPACGCSVVGVAERYSCGAGFGGVWFGALVVVGCVLWVEEGGSVFAPRLLFQCVFVAGLLSLLGVGLGRSGSFLWGGGGGAFRSRGGLGLWGVGGSWIGGRGCVVGLGYFQSVDVQMSATRRVLGWG